MLLFAVVINTLTRRAALEGAMTAELLTARGIRKAFGAVAGPERRFAHRKGRRSDVPAGRHTALANRR